MTTGSKEGEIVYLEKADLLVTNKRIVTGEETHAIKQITALGASVYRGGPKTISGANFGNLAAWCWRFWITVAVATTLCWFVWVIMKIPGLAAIPIVGSIISPLYIVSGLLPCVTVISLIVTVFLSLLWSFWPSDIHRVDFGTISRKEEAMLCRTKGDAEALSKAINDALFDNFALKNKFAHSSWC